MDLKQRLQQARRSTKVNITPERVEAIRKAKKEGISKKILTVIYGLSYQELKAI